ncbi:MAG: inositol monophosphatase [Chloroflexi bacterium]|nr:inositol monophosphatase [Chloroflexota bacterium]
MIELAKRAARCAAQILMDMYQQPMEVRVKGERDIVTAADVAAEAAVMQEILAGCPDAWIISEETHSRRMSDADRPTWYIDPLDGTTNYARGYPSFSVSIAMAQRGNLICGAVYDPLQNHLFWAERGKGAWLNDAPLRVSERSVLLESILLLDWPRDQQIRQKSAQALAALVPLTEAVRSTGSAALSLCYLAAGWADLYFQYTLKPWDVAAGALIIEEAGGHLSGIDGRPYALEQPDWLASNGRLHRAVLETGAF